MREILKLGQDDTLLLKSGNQETPVTFFEPGRAILCLDCSGSMEPVIEDAKKSAITFAEDARSRGYATGLVTFADDAKLIVRPDDSILLSDYISHVVTEIHTKMDKGLRLAAGTILTYPKGEKVIVVITDGHPDDADATTVWADKAKARGIRLLTIGIGTHADLVFLKKLASHEDFAQSVSVAALESAFHKAMQLLPPAGR